MFNRDYEINEKQVAEYLENAIEKVKTTEDVDTLSDLTKLFKKNVPLSLRKYLIAYLLKELLKNNRSFGNSRHNDRNARFEKNKNERRNKEAFKQNARAEKTAETNNTEKEEEHPHHARVEIPEDQSTSIFVSIGKNRRVFPRDLVGILISIAGLDRERIGDIKVLANYSFVQLYKEDAPLAIEKLNGYEYRGRKLAVSYSRQKTEEDGISENEEETDMTAEDAAAYAAAEKAAADKEPFGLN